MKLDIENQKLQRIKISNNILMKKELNFFLILYIVENIKMKTLIIHSFHKNNFFTIYI